MRRVLYLLSILILALSLVLPAWTQERGGEKGGERGGGGDRGGAKAAKRVVEVEGVISDVGEASISYQIEAKGKVAEKMIGVADVTRLEKIEWKPVKIKELQVGDKATITIYEDPEDPYFPALSVRVTGKGEVKKAKGRE